MRAIVDVVGYLHREKIAHNDIKPENIFLDENYKPVLGDLGCARKID